MSNKSGIAEQVITLAKGGGEMKGLGETFSPDLHTGTGNFSVPIALPAGRNSFQPEIGLSYSTGNGNTCFGLGWQLSVPGISRKTAKGIPRYDDEKDTFLLSGTEDLVPVEEGAGWTQYRPRTEGLFAQIRKYAAGYWEVKSKDGLVSYYGQSPYLPDAEPATVFDPVYPNNIFSWHLIETRDVFGNRIVYEYERDAQQEGPRHWNQLYLKRIKYLDYQDENGQEQFLASAVLEYEDGREDSFSVFTAGFEMRTRRLCIQIAAYTHPSPEESTLVKTYTFQYEHAPWTKTALLKTVQVKGHDGENVEAMPPLAFDYTTFEPEGQEFEPVGGRDFPTQSLAQADTELIGLFGNGLPDIIQMNGAVRYWKNKGNGEYSLPRTMPQAPAGWSIADPGVQFMDANGEGRVDLVTTGNGIAGFFPTTYEGKWDAASFQKYKQAPSFSFQDPEVKLVDLDGDGVTDVLRSGSRLEAYFNDAEKGWHHLITASRKGLDSFPNVNFSDPRVRLADMSGDGLQDIVLIHSRSVSYWANKGYNRWSKRIEMRNAPQLPPNYDPRRLLLGDIAGDGMHDLLYIENRKIHIWINQNGNGFSEPVTIEGTPPVADMDAVRLVDLYGTGTSGVLWSAEQRTNGRAHYFFLDLTDKVKPYVLNEMNNNMGAVTKVDYRPSTYYYLKDEKRAATRWKTQLPFPVQVVACVEVIDEISKNKLVTEYHYRHGYWDGAEREFRGFGRVEQTDTQSFEAYQTNSLHGAAPFQEVEAKFYAPPTKTITWFHQGAVGPGEGDWYVPDYTDEYWQGDGSLLSSFSPLDAFLETLSNRRQKRDALRTLRGSVLRTELYTLDDNSNIPWTVSESIYSIRKEGESLRPLKGMSKGIFFPMAVAQRSTNWERGDDPMTKFSFTQSYDAYGHALESINIACPRGWRRIEDAVAENDPFLSTFSVSELAYSAGDAPYIKGRSVKASAFEILHRGTQQLSDMLAATQNPDRLALIAQSLTYYDGEAFAGLPYGQLGAYGVPVRSESLVITPSILTDIWQGDLPPYLNPVDSPVQWTEEFPQSFRNSMPPLAGYRYHDGSGPQAAGYWAQSITKYDFQDEGTSYSKGLAMAQKDALGRQSTIEYDKYHFLPIQSTDPIGLSVEAENDYRLFQPYWSKGPNDNEAMVHFSPLGFVAANFLIGKEGKEEGDALNKNDPNAIASSTFAYDWRAWMERQQPISVRQEVREHHLYESNIPSGQENDTIISVQFSDGFGRIIQSRAQAEDVRFGDVNLGNELLPETQGSAEDTAPQTGIVRDADAPMNVIVSGWQVYDNKGQVVQQYEPFYSTGFEYADLSEQRIGQKVEQYYDPLGRVVKSVNPDGSEQLVLFGIPSAFPLPLSAFPLPTSHFTPSPWEAYTYDPNDNAGRTGHAERVEESHWNTPASIEVDALGRTVKAIARNREKQSDGSWSDIQEYITRSTYDIRGNLLTVTDALERLAFQHFYDLTFDEEEGSQAWRTDNIDAGVQKTIFNVLGLAVESRDSKNCVILNEYDDLNRPVRLWARDDAGLPITLRQKLIYGDTLSPSGEGWGEEKTLNLLGQLYQHYDEAGLVQADGYDFKGNPLNSHRQVLKTEKLVDVSGGAAFQHFQVDWETTDAEDYLENTVYETATAYDALNRPKKILYPEDVAGERKSVLPTYNRAGALESISLFSSNSDLEGNPPPSEGLGGAVRHIAYNARGQRTLIAYSNGLMTRYAYDDERFWLARLRTEKYTRSTDNPFEFIPNGGVKQDIAYEYDLVGNITKIKERGANLGTAGTGLGDDALDRAFDYDPIYRLIAATGREVARDNYPNNQQPWLQEMVPTHSQDVTNPTTRFYRRTYRYDKVGNMLQLRHFTPDSSSQFFTRSFILNGGNTAPHNNQLQSYQQGGNGPVHQLMYDANGNLVKEADSRHYHWNYADQLHSFRIQANETAAPSLEARYLYDAGGERVKKIVWHQGGKVTTTTYIGGLFEHHTEGTASDLAAKENNTLHLMDDQSRIALIRVGDTLDDQDNSPAIQYQLGDHLGNVQVVANNSGATHSREEHYPYGGSSLNSYAQKRYRFTGKERDEESGLHYHSARYYAPWMKKWISADPAGMVDGVNLYGYVGGNPIVNVDINGEDTIDIISFAARLAAGKKAENTVKSGLNSHVDQLTGMSHENRNQYVKDLIPDDPLYLLGKGIYDEGKGIYVEYKASYLAYERGDAKAFISHFQTANAKTQVFVFTMIFPYGKGVQGAKILAFSFFKSSKHARAVVRGAILLGDKRVRKAAKSMSKKTKIPMLTAGENLSGIKELSIVAHGSKSAIQLNGKWLTPKQLGKMLKDSGWQGERIRLVSCRTGLCDNTGSFAQKLADETGSAVIAPKGPVGVPIGRRGDGLPKVHPMDSEGKTIKWIHYDKGKGWDYVTPRPK